jgi:hypothetical protein
MPDFTLENGRDITFDLSKMSVKEYRRLFDKEQTQAEEDETLARVCGLTVDEYLAIPYPEWRSLTIAFFGAARRPLADPN